MKSIVVALPAVLVALAGTAEAAPQPSFNCAKARAPIEAAICSDEILASHDAEMAKLYKLNRRELEKGARADDNKTLKDEQKRWLRARLLVCGMRPKGNWSRNAANIACLAAMYTARMADLSTRLAKADAARPVGVCSIQGQTTSGAVVVCRFALGGSRGRALITLTQKDSAADVRITVPGRSPGERQIHLAEALLVMPDGAPSAIEFGDYNFDGFTDFSVIRFLPAGPNIPSSFALFDPEQGRFVLNERLAEMTSPTFDQRTRTVSSAWRGGAAHYGRDVLRWENGELVRVLALECMIGDRGALTVRIGDGKAIKRVAPSIKDCLNVVQAD